jgi:4-methylaminobutanoate oxidase (formaldehyde-forming)
VKEGRVHEVQTDQGAIRADVAVNAAGIWAPEIGRMAGVTVPLLPLRHQYLTTKPIDGVHPRMPTMRDPDLLDYFREEVGGLVVGGRERNPVPWGLESIPGDFNSTLLPPDWEQFAPLMENATRRIPALATAGIVRLIQGPEAFTPDVEFILGEAPEAGGFFVAAGWIVHGDPGLDLWRMDLQRFGGQYRFRRLVTERAREIYGTCYDIRSPGQERGTGRGLRLSPVRARLAALGAAFGEKAGWERPNWVEANAKDGSEAWRPRGFAGVHWSPAMEAEHAAIRAQAALFDETSFAKLEVVGPGALALLQASPARRSAPMTRAGSADTCRGTAPSRCSTSPAPTRASACSGRARDILAEVTDADVSHAGFPYLTARELAVGRAPVLAARVTYVGDLGWELYTPSEYGLELWDTLWEAGRPHGLVATGYRAIDSLRLEKGYRYWSADITPDDTPYEAGLGFAVRLGKGDFVGRDALVRQKAEGVRRKLCCLTLADPLAVALRVEPVRVDGRIVGRIASGSFGYTVGLSIAYAFLTVERGAPGVPVAVEVFGDWIPGVVAAEPLWDPRGERIRR